MSTLILFPEPSTKEKIEYFSRYLSKCKEVREQRKSEELDEMIAWLERYLAELEESILEAEG